MPSGALSVCSTEVWSALSPSGSLMVELAPLISVSFVSKAVAQWVPPSCFLGFSPSLFHLRRSLSYMFTHILFKLCFFFLCSFKSCPVYLRKFFFFFVLFQSQNKGGGGILVMVNIYEVHAGIIILTNDPITKSRGCCIYPFRGCLCQCSIFSA